MSYIIGIGTDIIECLRMARSWHHGELFINRVYTQHEIQYCQSRKMATQHFAGPWAAKEAILKALGTGWRGLPGEYRSPQSTRRETRGRIAGRRRRCRATGHSGNADQHFALPAAMPRPMRLARGTEKKPDEQ